MLWLYRLLFLPVLLLLAPRYLLRMRRRGGYREGFTQRFGAYAPPPPKSADRPRLWLQAVSVGEILAIGPLLEALRSDRAEIYLTTTTSTGRQVARERYAHLLAGIGYFPIDWWPLSRRAWRRLDPDLALLTEGERWPEHLHQAEARGVSVLCLNARLSDRSYARMRRLRPFARLMLGRTPRYLTASPADAERLRELGVSDDRIQVTGNLKLDARIPPLANEERARLRAELGLPRGLIVLGSSTWPGEEAALLGALQQARGEGLPCTLLLVPRHAERRAEIEALLRPSGLRYHFRSRGLAGGEVDVAVGDTTGELRRLTQLADVVFVGKSLPPHTEGQTPVEAASLRKALLFGPGMSNFRTLAGELLAAGGALEVASPSALREAVPGLLRDSARREALGAAAAAWHGGNVGALDRTLAAIREELSRCRRRKATPP